MTRFSVLSADTGRPSADTVDMVKSDAAWIESSSGVPAVAAGSSITCGSPFPGAIEKARFSLLRSGVLVGETPGGNSAALASL